MSKIININDGNPPPADPVVEGKLKLAGALDKMSRLVRSNAVLAEALDLHAVDLDLVMIAGLLQTQSEEVLNSMKTDDEAEDET